MLRTHSLWPIGYGPCQAGPIAQDVCFSHEKDSGNIVEFDHASQLLQDEESIFKGMVDESKDRKQLYNSLKLRSTIKSKPEVNTGSSQREFESQKISSKMTGSKKINVEPFEDDFEHPLETSL